MILYLMGPYKLHLGEANQILLLSAAASKFMPVIGAFIADSYLGRFLSVGLGSAVSFLVCLYILKFKLAKYSINTLNLGFKLQLRSLRL